MVSPLFFVTVFHPQRLSQSVRLSLTYLLLAVSHLPLGSKFQEEVIVSTLFTFLFLGSDPASDSQGVLSKCCRESEGVKDGCE